MINGIIQYARSNGCSDIHLTYGLPPVLRRNGSIFIGYDLGSTDSDALIDSMLTDPQRQTLAQGQDVDFCYTTPMLERQRVNVYHQQGHLCAAIRILNAVIPSFAQLQLPKAIQALAELPSGLVLVTGPTGSGKSTTLASMIDYINANRSCHIITMEDPIEYLHTHNNAIVHQREVGKDVSDFATALRSALREDPDVILVGELRDLETVSAAITAAETGHLVLSTLHTTGAANTIDRIIDVFPAGGKDQIRSQLSTVLRGVVTQQLLPTADGTGRCGAFEVLLGTDAIANLIRENKCFQIPSLLQTGINEGMCSMNYDLARLVSSGKVDPETALAHSPNKAELLRFMGR